MTPGGDAAKVCEVLCVAGTCVGNQCVVGAQLAATAVASASQYFDNPPMPYGGASMCEIGPMTVQYDVVATSGPCSMVKETYLLGANMNLPFDAGTVTYSSPLAGDVELPVVNDCRKLELPYDVVFTPGSLSAMTVTGGADYPAFAIDAVAPNDFTIEVTPLLAGAPVTVTWTTALPTDFVMIGSVDRVALCKPDSPGEVTVSAGMMALLLQGETTAFAGVYRYASTGADIPGAAHPVRMYFIRSHGRALKLGP